MAQRTRPTIPESVPKALRDNIEILGAEGGQLSARIDKVEPAIANLGARPVALTIDQIRGLLEYGGGPNSLNVTGLAGVLAQPQKAGIPLLQAFPPVTGTDNGLLVNVAGILYYFDSTNTDPGQWIPIASNSVLPIGAHADRPSPSTQPVGGMYFESDRSALYGITNPGTGNVWNLLLSRPMQDVIANIPTDLGVDDEGFMFGATDFNRVYYWSGAAWQDAVGQDPRQMYAFFGVPPGPGWHEADGATVDISTSTGGTTPITLPNFTTIPTFLRGKVIAGGTGAMTTGAGASQFYDALPYVRL